MTQDNASGINTPFLIAALALSAIIPALGFPVYFRTDDVHWLGWAVSHGNPLAAFSPAENLFGYYRPIPTLVWWILYRLFHFNPLPYQIALALTAVLAMWPLFRITARIGGGAWAGLLGVALFHAVWFNILYYVYWFSALTFGLEILFLLLAFDALTDGDAPPGRPVAFLIFALAAGLCKQPALILLPITGGLLILSAPGSAARKRAWVVGIAAGAAALLLLTPFVVHRPEKLAGLSGGLSEFVLQRFRFYAATLVHGVGTPIVTACAAAAVGRALTRERLGGGWVGFCLGGLLGLGLARLDLLAATPAWLLLLLAAVIAEKKSLPWVAGFLIPVIALLGVDFFVATYLLEPALMLMPALVLWVAPQLKSPAQAFEKWFSKSRPLQILAGPAIVAAAGLVIFVAWPRVAPVESMRDVRATFRSLVTHLVENEAEGTTIGSLSYEELGRSYAEIRAESLENRVARHKTMNPAQLGKLLGLLGRPDLSVTSVTEAVQSSGPRRLVALNSAEREILAKRPGVLEKEIFQQGSASASLFELRRDPP